MSKLLAQLKAARRVSVPLVAIATPDPAATIELVTEHVFDPVVQWDLCRGLTSLNDKGKLALSELNVPEEEIKGNPVAMLLAAARLPKGTVLILHMAHRFLDNAMVVQAVWNLRDAFKLNRRMVLLLGTSFVLPAEIAGDVVLLDEPLPDGKQLSQIVRNEFENAGLDTIQENLLSRAIEALAGLPAFAAEQVTAMSLGKQPGEKQPSLDLDALWERKRQQIEQTPGLRVYRGGEKFSDIGGVEVVKDFLRRIMHGEARPNCVVFIDEIEKMLAGARGDMSGVTQDQLGSLLAYMQDKHCAGMIFVGPPGSAKSMVAKAAGSAGCEGSAIASSNTGVPTIQLDLGAAKGSLVGQSEQQLRTALKVVTAVSSGKSLWIATCNSIGELPPELRRRFTLGTFFFDLPSRSEREKIWELWRGKYGQDGDRREPHELGVHDEGWTGAEIRQCCEISWRLGCSLSEAAKFIVPVSKSAYEQIDRLRSLANGNFLSASYPGVYDPRRREEEQETGSGSQEAGTKRRRAVAVE